MVDLILTIQPSVVLLNRFITYFLFAVFILFSCRSHFINEDDNRPRGYADSQVVGNWKITAVSSDVANDWNGDGLAEKDIYITWSACQKDHLYTFAPDKTGTFKLNCSTTEPGSWEIINTQYLLYSSPANGIESERIIAMTSVEFKTTQDFTLPNGQTATITKTWTRQ